MELFGIIYAAIELAQKLIDRAAQTGELTTEQKAVLQAKADGIFAKYDKPAPPPPGV